MSLEVLVYTVYVRIALALIGATLCFIQFKKRKKEIRILMFVLIASALADASPFIVMLMGIKGANNYGSSIYQIIAVPLLSAVFYYAIEKRYATFFIVISILHVLPGLVDILFIQKDEINTYTMASGSIICILFCVIYFYWLLKALPTIHVQRLPMFWITTALILYQSGALFLFIFTSYLVNILGSDLLKYWQIHNVLGIVEEVIFIFALCLDLRNTKSAS